MLLICSIGKRKAILRGKGYGFLLRPLQKDTHPLQNRRSTNHRRTDFPVLFKKFADIDSIDIEINDFETSDVELAVEFEEPIEVVPDESGQLEFDGRRWSVAPVPVCAVERITGMTGRIKP